MNASILCLEWAWLLVGSVVQLNLSTYLDIHPDVWSIGDCTGRSSFFLPLSPFYMDSVAGREA